MAFKSLAILLLLVAVFSQTQAGCKDKSSKCSGYVRKNYCTKYAKGMNKMCAKSCGKCSESDCKDKSSMCSIYASKNYCTSYGRTKWMNRDCAKSCGKCSESGTIKKGTTKKGCKDKSSKCSKYVSRSKNYCTRYAWTCAKSCGKCSESGKEQNLGSCQYKNRSDKCDRYKSMCNHKNANYRRRANKLCPKTCKC